jgi:ornithine cyclodeaminase/alanine dehydrogenase-like protein (mu-crystallin family)
MSTFRHFTTEEIKHSIPMEKAIELMRQAFMLLSSDNAAVPLRTVIESRDHTGRALFMPSYSGAYGLFGLKMVAVYENNEINNLPIIQGKMLVTDSKNGVPLALLDAEYLTALRTGAASGLATDLLARENAQVLALFGTGTQAVTQLAGVTAVRDIKKVLVFGKTTARARAFIESVASLYSAEFVVSTDLTLLREADVICTATTSSTPLFPVTALKEGVHINAIGSFKPTMQELDASVILQSLLIVDQREAALSEAGDIVIPIQQGRMGREHIHAELGEVVSGFRKGRTADQQLTVFKSVGNAIQDLAIAHGMLKG